MTRTKKVLLGGAAVVAVGAVLAAGRGRTAAAEGPTTSTSDVATAEVRELAVHADAAGAVEPMRVVEVKSKASGEILRLLVKTGDFVKQGVVLAEIDPRDVQNALDQAEADQQVAEVQFRTTHAKRERVEELRKSNAMTQEEYESAVQAEASAQATLVRARTNLQLARVRRGDAQVSAPTAGTIIERPVEAGQIITSATANISGGTTLVKMADLSQMQVRAKVDETDIGRVAAGQSVAVSVDAYAGRTFPGQVLKVEPQAVVEQNVTMFPVLVTIDNRDGLLRPGMNAKVSIDVVNRGRVLTVPNGAVVGARGAVAAGALLKLPEPAVRAVTDVRSDATAAGTRPVVVFVQTAAAAGANATPRVEPRRVIAGASDGDRTEIVSGLKPGETVTLVSVVRLRAEQAAGGGFGGGPPR